MKTSSMKIKLFILLNILSLPLFCCDICPIEEYSTLRNRGYIGVFYRYSHFNGYNTLNQSNDFAFQTSRSKKHNIFQDDNFYEDSPEDFEAFHTMEIRANYNLKDKWNFLLVVPYHYNINYYDKVTPPIGQTFDSTTVTQGIGDIILGVQRLSTIEKEKWVHRFKYGVGFTLPTGFSEIRENELSAPNDPSHLPGKGAVDFMVRLNYITSASDKYGLQANLILAHSLKSSTNPNISNNIGQVGLESYNFRFGNRYGGDLLGFYVLGKSKLKAVPKLGSSIYYGRYDQLNGEIVENSGGTEWSASLGLDILFGKFTLQNTFQKPLTQSLNGVQIENSGRFQVGLLYSLRN